MSPESNRSSSGGRWGPFLAGLLHAVIASLLLSFLVGLLLRFTGLSDQLLPTLSVIILLVSLFWGGCQAARLAGSRGLMLGLGLGVAYFVFSLLVGLAFDSPPPAALDLARRAGYSLLGGGLGGIFGVAWFQR